MITRRLRAVGMWACLAAAVGCADTLIGPAASGDHAAVFDEVWHQFDLHYSFFELKKINWDSLGAHYRPLAIAASTDQELASVIARMLAELHDVHVSLSPTGTQTTMRYVSPVDTTPTFFSADLVFRRYVPTASTSPSGRVRYGMVTATVGYIRLWTFDGGGWASDVDAALDQLRGATKLIVDVRGNLGGRHSLATEIAGRFADRSRTFGYLRYRNGQNHGDFTPFVEETVSPAGPRQFTGPVYVLTNRKVFSTAEDFVMAMSALPQTTVVGDTTAGASGGPIVRDLPNGWTFQLSEWIEYTPDRRTFEGIGLAPNSVVKPTAADYKNDADLVLERAIALATLRAVP